jgi:hypothetical protein
VSGAPARRDRPIPAQPGPPDIPARACARARARAAEVRHISHESPYPSATGSDSVSSARRVAGR